MHEWKVRLTKSEKCFLSGAFVAIVAVAMGYSIWQSDPLAMMGLLPAIVVYALPWPAKHPDGSPGSFTCFDCFTQKD